jgi:AsmA protein
MKKAVVISLGVLVLAVVGAVLWLKALDLGDYTSKIESQIQEATGFEAHISTAPEISFLPFGVVASGITLHDPKTQNRLAVEALKVHIAFWPLLRQEIIVDTLELTRPSLVLHAPVVLPQAPPQNTQNTPSFSINTLRIVEGFVEDTRSNTRLEGIDIHAQEVVFATAEAFELKGDVAIAKARVGAHEVSQLRSLFALTPKAFHLRDSVGTWRKNAVQGEATVEIEGENPFVHVKINSPRLDLRHLFTEAKSNLGMEGVARVAVALSFPAKEPMPQLKGDVSIQAAQVQLLGIDLDRVITQYQKTQAFDAVDIGAFLVAGPVGALLTKSGDALGAWSGASGGETEVVSMRGDIAIVQGIATFEDVALATKQHRLAITGALDLPRQRFLGVHVGILDEAGCAVYAQAVEGTFSAPKIKTDQALLSQVGNMVGSLFGIVKRAAGVEEKRCESPFYSGAVAHP